MINIRDTIQDMGSINGFASQIRMNSTLNESTFVFNPELNTVSDKEIMVGAVLYILLMSVDPQYKGGKRGRKNMIKELFKVLKTYRKNRFTNNNEHYLGLVNRADDCKYVAREKMFVLIKERADHIDPGVAFKFILKRYPSYVASYDLKDSHIQDLVEHYKGANLAYDSIRYINRLIAAINDSLGIKLPNESINVQY